MSACHISLFILWHSDSISKDQKGGAFFRKPSASKCDLLDTMVYKRRNKCCNKKDKVFFHSFAAVFIPRANSLSCLLSLYCTGLPLQAVQTGSLGERETSEKVWVGGLEIAVVDCPDLVSFLLPLCSYLSSSVVSKLFMSEKHCPLFPSRTSVSTYVCRDHVLGGIKFFLLFCGRRGFTTSFW